MINNNAKAMIIALALLAQPMQTRTYPTDPSVAVFNDVATIASLGLVAAGCYAVYANYYDSHLDESIIYEARMLDGNDTPVINHMSSAQCVIDENVLRAIQQKYVHQYFYSYKEEISSRLDPIRSSLKKLNDRMKTLDDNGRRYSDAYMVMSGLVNSLSSKEFALRRTEEVLSQHSSFFELYALNSKIRDEYVHVLGIVESHGNDGFDIATSLHNYVTMPANYFNPYPIVSYVEALDKKICALGNAINKCVHNYENLLAGAHDIYNKLCFVRSVLMAGDRYAYEMRAREQARCEQARIEREQARIERDRLERERRAAQLAIEKAKAEIRELERQKIQEQQRQEIARKEQARIARERAAQAAQEQRNNEAKAAQKRDDIELQFTMGFE